MRLTVQDLADHYGVSVAFTVQALATIGFRNAKSDTPLSTPTINRFEKQYGDKIRAAPPATGRRVRPTSRRSGRNACRMSGPGPTWSAWPTSASPRSTAQARL